MNPNKKITKIAYDDPVASRLMDTAAAAIDAGSFDALLKDDMSLADLDTLSRDLSSILHIVASRLADIEAQNRSTTADASEPVSERSILTWACMGISMVAAKVVDRFVDPAPSVGFPSQESDTDESEE